MSYYFCNLTQAKNELKASSTVDDALLREFVEQASARVNQYLQHITEQHIPYFLPYLGSKKFIMTPDNVSSRLNTFKFWSPLVEFTQVEVEGSDVTSNVRAYPHPALTPFWTLELKTNKSWWNYCGGSSFYAKHVEITGVWGWIPDYPNVWLPVDSIQNVGGISSSATSLTVADVDGENPYGVTPRISPLDYIKVDDEVMLVLSTNTTTNVVTVKRGMLGTSPSTHAGGASVKVYQQVPTIIRVVARQAALMYARQGSFQTQTIDGVGVISMPADLLTEMKAVLQRFVVV